METMFPSRVADEELARQALEADPDVALDDAVPFASLGMTSSEGTLPEWYMPTPMLRPRSVRGWRRHAIALIVASFLAINAYGLCNTYGDLSPRTVQARTHTAP